MTIYFVIIYSVYPKRLSKVQINLLAIIYKAISLRLDVV